MARWLSSAWALTLLMTPGWTAAFDLPKANTRQLAPACQSPSSLASSWSEEYEQDTSSSCRSLVRSVNYFISRKCNYACRFCFHTAKTSHHLPLRDAMRGLRMLRQAGTQKINFAGGEPFLHPLLLGELCRYSHETLGMAVSIISNGSLISREWMEDYGRFVNVLGVSVDSFCPATNAAIGRGEPSDDRNRHVSRVLRVRDECARHNIGFKLNTVVCRLNWQEDMNEAVRQLDPVRWKVFQVLLLRDENTGRPGELRNARPLLISSHQFRSFVDRHQEACPQLIAEPNDVMQNSYLLLDENLCFLDCSQGGKVPSESILEVGVARALQQSGFDVDMFERRGGIYNWERPRSVPPQQCDVKAS